jgi:hypothetical protein
MDMEMRTWMLDAATWMSTKWGRGDVWWVDQGSTRLVRVWLHAASDLEKSVECKGDRGTRSERLDCDWSEMDLLNDTSVGSAGSSSASTIHHTSSFQTHPLPASTASHFATGQECTHGQMHGARWPRASHGMHKWTDIKCTVQQKWH